MKQSSVPKAVEKVLAGAIRREMALEDFVPSKLLKLGTLIVWCNSTNMRENAMPL
ncbi:hypothetical protein Patl1_37600 [Pistacia atlantica]|nr:hypothetical protein Patl1_37600 [Pistacia atlantica]